MRFKKCTSLFLALLLLVSNLGLAFNVHYCGGKIAAVSTVYNISEVCEKPVVTEKECCAKAEVTHERCCDDKVVDLQGDADTKIVVKMFSVDVAAPFTVSIPQQKPDFFEPVVLRVEPAAYYCESHAPPLFKLYKKLLFYA